VSASLVQTALTLIFLIEGLYTGNSVFGSRMLQGLLKERGTNRRRVLHVATLMKKGGPQGVRYRPNIRD
jgi:hypothetical protein